MTKDKIMQMAREAGMQRQCHNLASNPVQYRYSYDGSEESLERFFHMAQAAEREACAKLCLETEPFYGVMFAKAIRARDKHE